MGRQLKKIMKASLRTAAELCAREFTLVFPEGEEKIFVRTQSQTDISAASEETKPQRDAIREKYRKGGEYWNAVLQDLELRSPRELAREMISTELEDIQRKARSKVKRPLPPSNSAYKSEADRIKQQMDYENAIRQMESEIESIGEDMIVQREQELLAGSREELLENVCALTVENMIREENAVLFIRYRIFNSVYDAEDKQKRYFDSIDEVPETIQVIKLLNRMINAVDNIEPFMIKNLQGRSDTQTGSAENILETTQESSISDSLE